MILCVLHPLRVKNKTIIRVKVIVSDEKFSREFLASDDRSHVVG